MNNVMKVIKDMGLSPYNQEYNLNCSVKVDVRLNNIDKFEQCFDKAEGIRIIKI